VSGDVEGRHAPEEITLFKRLGPRSKTWLARCWSIVGCGITSLRRVDSPNYGAVVGLRDLAAYRRTVIRGRGGPRPMWAVVGRWLAKWRRPLKLAAPIGQSREIEMRLARMRILSATKVDPPMQRPTPDPGRDGG